MKVETLALVDIVTGEKQEIAWICAFSEIEKEPGNALAKLQNWMVPPGSSEPEKEALEHVCLPGKKTALLKG